MSDPRRSVTALLLLALATPLVWAQGFLFPYVVPKAFFFQAVVALALLAWIPAWIGGGDAGGGSRRTASPLRRDPAAWALAALVAVGSVSALLGEVPARSLLGTFERRWGVLAWSLFLVFYGLLRLQLGARGWRRALRITALVATAVAAVGIVGHHGLLGGGGTDAPWRRAAGTLGNAGYLGAYLVLTATATAYLAWSTRSPARRALWSLAGALQAYGLVLTGTRAVVLGALAGLVVAAAGGVLLGSNRRVRAISAAAAGVAVLAAAALWAAPADGFLGRWSERLVALSTEATSMQMRFAVWGAAAAGFREAPLVGVGPENFHLVWSRHFDPVVYDLNPEGTSFDRAHDVLAEAGATMGAGGLLAVLGLWVAVGWSLVRARRRRGLSGPATAIFGFGFTAYLVYLLFWFEDYGSFVVFLTLVGFVAHRAYATPGGGRGHPTSDGGVLRSLPARTFLAVPMVALVGLSAWHNIRTLEAARDAWRGELAMDAWEGAESYRAALALDLPGSGAIVRVYLRRLSYLARFGDRGSPEGPTARMEEVLRAADRAIGAWEDRDPEHPGVHVQKARLCALRQDVLGASPDGSCAVPSLRRAIELSPRQIRYRHMLARHHLGAGRPEAALSVLERTLEIHDTFGETYYFLSRAHWERGDREEALRQARTAVDLGYGGQSATYLGEIVDWLEGEGRHGAAADLVEAHLALTYRRLSRPGASTPPGRGFLPWDLPLASRLPMLHWRADRPDEAIRTAEFVAHRLGTVNGEGEARHGARIRGFIGDVQAGRRERWRGVRGVLEGGSSPSAPSGAAGGAAAPPGSGPGGDETGVRPSPDPVPDEDLDGEDPDPGAQEAAAQTRRRLHAPGADGGPGGDRDRGGGRRLGVAGPAGADRAGSGGIGVPGPAGPGQDAGHRAAGRGPDPGLAGRSAHPGGSGGEGREPDGSAERSLPGGLGPAPPRDAAIQQSGPGGTGEPLPVPGTARRAHREQLPGTAPDRAIPGPVSRRDAALFSTGVHPLRKT